MAIGLLLCSVVDIVNIQLNVDAVNILDHIIE